MSDIASVSSKELLDIQATTQCRFTLKRVCVMIRTYSLLVILAIFLSTFILINFKSVNFLVNRHLSRGHRIAYIAHQLEHINNKPFSGLIVPRHMTTSRAVAHQSEMARWVARCFLRVLQFSQSIQIEYYTFGHQNRNNNDSLLLLFGGLWKVKANYMV